MLPQHRQCLTTRRVYSKRLGQFAGAGDTSSF